MKSKTYNWHHMHRNRRRDGVRWIINLIIKFTPFWLYKLLNYKKFKSWAVSEQDLESFRALNQLLCQLEKDVKAQLVRLNSELITMVKNNTIDDYEILVRFCFHLREGHKDCYPDDSDNIFAAVEMLGDVTPDYDECDFNYLDDGKDWNHLRELKSYDLRHQHHCYTMHCLLNEIMATGQIFNCEAVWVDVKPIIQFVRYHPSFKGEKFRSNRADF